MNQFSALFQTLGTITQLSDKITTIMIAVIVFFLLDTQFQFSENYRQNEMHGRLKDLLGISYEGNNMSKRVPSGVALEVLENELLGLKADLAALRSDSIKSVEFENRAGRGENKKGNDSTVSKGGNSGERALFMADSVRSDSAANAPPKKYECLECFRISPCVLTVLTSGFWFFMYGFASFFYIFFLKVKALKKDEERISWPSAGLATIAVVALLGPFILLATGFAASLPEFYSPLFNYVLNIAISGFLLQAVSKVFASFFVGDTVSAVKEETLPNNEHEAPVQGNFWERLGWLFGISSKK